MSIVDGHVGRQDLRDAADAGGDDQQPAARRLDNHGAERLGEGRVEVYLPRHHEVADLLVADAAEEHDALLQAVLLDHLLQIDLFWPRAGDAEPHAGVERADPRDYGQQKVGALVGEQAAADDDCDVAFVGSEGIGRKVLADHGVRDHRDHCRVQIGPEHRVLAAGMADGDDVVDVRQSEFEQLVDENGPGVGESKQRVVGEHRGEPHGVAVHDRLVAEAGHGPVAVHDVDLLADHDVAENGEEREHGGERRLAVHHEKRHVVHLESVGQRAHARPLPVRVGHNDHRVPQIDELLRHLVDVQLHAAGLRVEEVADHGDIQPHGRGGFVILLMDAPPDYEAATGRLLGRSSEEAGAGDAPRRSYEQFDVEEGASGAGSAGNSGAARLGPVEFVKLNVVVPVRHFVVDPVAQLWHRLCAATTLVVGKVMNPLLAKRLFVLVCTIGVLTFVYWKFDFSVPPTEWRNPEPLRTAYNSFLTRESMQHTQEYLQGMTHNTGTMGSQATAQFIKGTWESYGLDEVDFNEYPAFLTFANSSSLELLAGDAVALTTDLAEDEALTEPTTSQKQPRPHMGLGVPGDATGHLIYANYGTEDDFRVLAKAGVSLENAIIIMKHGKGPAAVKAFLAEQYKARGVLLFSEKHPSLAAWPDGPDYSEGAVQRASLGVAGVYPGDVLSPGWNSRMGMRLEDYHECRNLVKIPVLSLSWRQVEPYLQAVAGHGIKVDDWHNFGYPRGVSEWWTGAATSPQAHMVVQPAIADHHAVQNVVGLMRGSEQEDKSVIIGARYDDSCFGGVALSGLTVLNEVAKALGKMRYESNWRPRRSIYFAAWTGTADNFIGSTEWIETIRDQVLNAGVIYIDLDAGAWGPQLDVKGHPSIDLEDILRAIDDPETKSDTPRSVWDAWQARRGPDLVAEQPLGFSNAMGLANHASTPTISLGFTGEVYPADSCFDTVEWQRRFGDADLRYHEALAKIAGYLVIEYADQPIIPYNMVAFGQALKRYLDDAKDYAHERFGAAANDIDLGGAYTAAEEVVEGGLKVSQFTNDWLSLMIRLNNNMDQEPAPVTAMRHILNSKVVAAHIQGFDRVGLKNREWFKNMLFGPQFVPPLERTLGGTFPGLRDAIAGGNLEEAVAEARRVTTAIALTANVILDH